MATRSVFLYVLIGLSAAILSVIAKRVFGMPPVVATVGLVAVGFWIGHQITKEAPERDA